jgi:DNA-binding HxlR family transcriptional regulator
MDAISQFNAAKTNAINSEAPLICRPKVCSIARALNVLGESWSFLLLRAAFFGAHRFSEFATAVGAPKAQLVGGLKRLVRVGVLDQSDRGYTLAEPGVALFPICVGLMRWGDTWSALAGELQPPVRLAWRDQPTHLLQPALVCAACGGAIDPMHSVWQAGPGAQTESATVKGLETPATRRRPPNVQLLTRGRPCSVSRALQKIGGYWSFLILREAYFGISRFEDFVEHLGASRSVVSARLAVLVAAQVLSKMPIDSSGLRLEYRLTPSGLSLFPTIVALIDWGDRFVAPDLGAPLLLTHTVCGHALHARLVDLDNGAEISPAAVVPIYPIQN